MVVVKIQFLSGCWTEGLSCSLSVGGKPHSSLPCELLPRAALKMVAGYHFLKASKTEGE